MMPTIVKYASRQFLMQLVFALVGLVSLLQLFDLLNNATDILRRHDDNLLALAKYAFLRLPQATVLLMPFSVLLACLIALSRLAIYNEVLVLKAAGLPYYRLLVAFVPAVLLASLVHFFISDQINPITSRALLEWDARADLADISRSYTPGNPVWIRDGELTVRVGTVFGDGYELSNVVQFVRDPRRNLVARINANHASYRNGQWVLTGVETFSVTRGATEAYRRAATMVWDTRLTPGHFSDMAATPSSLSLRELRRFVSSPGVGAHASYFYETWLFKRLAIPPISLLMLLLAAPVAQGMMRQGSMAAGYMIGIGLGFFYFVTDGLVLALGEAGAIPPVLAAWTPAALFGSIGGAALLRMEGY